ncbi:pyridoxal phosphate-dependent aminotransferase [Caulobacter segnis]|uniref:pyridoxal phosphate-dependent aminotransferase n=1 Tax=Caulobacter segnis TaxID=88688 RepID=UPI00240FCEFB|nr:pyridoxal phosphate-dependent aminotransferase [Caulobacter segnis]MDG2523038.1 pyridoxal phosphate-dependent aminotransferase [Caulobacter segnis]
MTVSNVRAQRAATAPGQSYPRWVRTALTRAAEESEAIILFDSTIREPTELLAGVVRRAFAQPITDRYESVFSSGNSFVTAAVAKRYGVEPDQVISASSATSAIAMAIRAFVRPGERVLVETPGFDLLSTLVREAGAIVDDLPRRAPDFSVDPDALAAAIRRDTRLILLTQLHNPSGVALQPEVLARIGEVAERAGVPVVVDAVYADFIGSQAFLPMGRQFIVANSLSKVHGLFTLRCGWLTASRENIARIEAANSQGDLAVSKLTHAVAALVLEDLAPFDAHWRSALGAARSVVERHARDMISAGLIEGDLPPYGCMYFPRVIDVDDTLALSERLWDEHRLLVAPGEFFGLPGHIRIGMGGDVEALDRGLARLAQALSGRG